jgi:glycyl-tRNA synthetase
MSGFSDSMVDWKESKTRFRADQLFFAKVSVLESLDRQEIVENKANHLKRKLAVTEGLDALKSYTEATEDEYTSILSAATDKPGSLTRPRDFNLIFKTSLDALNDFTGQGMCAQKRPRNSS